MGGSFNYTQARKHTPSHTLVNKQGQRCQCLAKQTVHFIIPKHILVEICGKSASVT